MKQRKEMDYAAQLNRAIREYEDCEDYRPFHQHSIHWIVDRIAWCWKFRKITRKQFEDFSDRVLELLEEYRGVDLFSSGTLKRI